uniref:Uncharacterized protein n=1 Tax=Tanacetum cinerariifolium TaxID=118510 RepID=A0A6L2LPF2_TANCI|nr:hypothetical protein [Tanacetum cinerariifolium]
MVVDPTNSTVPILKPLSKMTKGNKKKYIPNVRVMNYLLQAIPNDIYNSVDACKNAKEMWGRIKWLRHGSEIIIHVRHSRLMDEFDKFATKERESLDSVHERLTTLINIMDRNNVRSIPVAINTKFLNYLQPAWSKYVTMLRHNQTRSAVSYDVLYDMLVQFEPHVLASRAKKAAKNHDPLALIAYSNASLSHSHANSSYSPQPYYVTHPPSVIDYDDKYQGELQGNSEEDKLTTAMIGIANNNAGRNKTKGLNTGNSSDESNQIIQRVPQTESTLGMKDEAGSNLSNEENNFILDTSDREELEELTAAVMLMPRIQPAGKNAETIPSYDATPVSQAYQEREDWYLDDIVDLEENLSSHDRIVYKMGQSIQMILILKKKQNKIYDSSLKTGLGYTNLEHLKKAIAAQPKMYDGELIYSNKLVIHPTNFEETLEDTEESQNKMRHKMVQIDYEKLNALYETFVPQQELSTKQTYFLIPSTSDNGSKSKDISSESPEQQKHELLKVELKKSASDSRDIHTNLIKRIKILENDFQISQAQSIAFEPKLQHQKETMNCDVSWKTKLSTLHDENVLLKHQVESTVKERENIKLEYQRLFNSVKATQAQHQKEINEKFKDVTQKTYAYAKVRAQNQDLLMTISELKIVKTKNVSNAKATSDSHDVFLYSHEKCVARNAVTRKSSVKRALFTSLVPAKSKSLEAASTRKPRKPTRKVTQVPQPSDLIEHVADEAVHKELGDILVRAATIASSLEAEQDKGNINRTQSKPTPNESSSQGTSSHGGLLCQEAIRIPLLKLGLRMYLNNLMIHFSQEGRRIDDIDVDEDITLVNVKADAKMFDADKDLGDEKVFVEQEVVADKEKIDEVTLAQAHAKLKISKPKAKGVVIQELKEPVKPKKKDQIRLDEEVALKLQAEYDEEQRLAREKAEKELKANITLIET